MSAGSVSLDILLNQISVDALSGSEDAVKDIKRRYPSLTDKEQREWHYTTLGQRWITENNIERCVDWLNEHHFDYRGLIEKGLALEAPKDMYKKD